MVISGKGQHIGMALYAVIGNPIVQSKSPDIHMEFARQTGEDLEYIRIEGRVGGFAADVDAFRARGGRGLNVTTPFKLDAFAYATELQEGARLAGAVNCLSFEGDKAVAANYDGVGLVRDIRINLAVPMAGKRVLLLGAGGAVRGVLLPFLEERPAELVVANRTVSKVEGLRTEFSGYGDFGAVGYDALARAGRFDVVVNATSASLYGEVPPVPAAAFGPHCLAYDLTYGKGLTPFLRRAREAGAERLADGVGMLVEQAAEAFVLWRGIRPATEAMIRKMTIALV